MNELETKRHIEQTLARFSKGNLRENGIAFLNALGYRSGREVVLEPNTFDGLADIHAPIAQINREKALVADWVSVDILFQLTGDDIRELAQARFVFDGTTRVDNQIIESYLFITIKLKQAEYSRSKFADITREINKFFAMPVMVLFQHGSSLTLSLINRRLNKREENKDVLEKVTLIKGINYAAPLRAHIEILFDLSLNQLQKDTRFHNFVDLHHAWQKALDTSELNKKFYREVANWYFWAVKKVEFPAGAGQDRETRNATSVIRLITRLIFVWFIKEKGLVPDDLFDNRRLKELLKFNDSKDSTYYKAILQNLFFATLNTEMGKERRFRGKNKNPNGMDSHHGISTVYRYEDYFNNPAEALRLFANIPFLNGGLFECLDKREEKILVDGFSDDPRNQPVVPDELFFGKDRSVDLNEVYGDTRHSRENVRGLIHVFNSYKFTIEENTPLEEEIALDPELLGKVFENLLAAFNPETGTTARKQTGSFYTPREIVNYMVDESLIAYLETKLAEYGHERSDNQTRLRHLLAYNQEPHPFNEVESKSLITAIDAIKVLDPACGSGAFPMGVLHKLVFILSKLDSGNQRWKQRQIDKAVEIPDPAVRERVIEDIEKSFAENELDYGRKLYLIENCIYGVDIQPIAVQIAKLRFFISLVVDQKIDPARPNLGVRPLPNLETKFVAANTLIGIERPPQMMFRNPEIDEKEKRLAEVRDALFTARTPATKRKYREQDQKLRNELAALLRNDGWGSASAAQLAGWDPYDQNTSAVFFDPEWMFGAEGGFDVVIGNPPYGARIDPELINKFRVLYPNSLKGKVESYRLFIECGLKITSNSGSLTYVVPNTWMFLEQAHQLRLHILRNTTIRTIISFPQSSFDATVDSVAFLLLKKLSSNNLVSVFELPLNESLTNLASYLNSGISYSQKNWLNSNKAIISYGQNSRERDVIEKLRKNHPSFNDYIYIRQGLIPYLTKEEGKENKYISSTQVDSNWSEYLDGSRCVDRYSLKGSISYIKYGSWLYAPREKEIFELPRIIYQLIRNISLNRRIVATFLDRKLYSDRNTGLIFLKHTAKIDLKYVLGLLNSNLLNFIHSKSHNSTYISFPSIEILPLAIGNDSTQLKVISLVDKILSSKQSDPKADTSSFEREIDQLVYILYGLTDDEIAVVEGRESNASVLATDDEDLGEPEEIPASPTPPAFHSSLADDRAESASVTEPTDYGLYKCGVCGQLVTGFMKDGHAQEKHQGRMIEWKKIGG